jgi:hypothetical protein
MSLTLASRGESSSCDLTIPLQNIDSTIFAKQASNENKVAVQVYVGYIHDSISPEETMKEIESLWASRSSRNSRLNSTFSKRFDGFVAQPEWTFGDERTLNLKCYDWSQMLKEYKWPKNLKDGDTEVSRVISLINKNLDDFNIVADKYIGAQRLGDRDTESNTITYNSSGKSYWEVLQECADKINKKLFIMGRTIYIRTAMEEPLEWPMYYGPYEKNYDKDKKLRLGQYFSELKLRHGEIGEAVKSNVVVELHSSKLTKKGDAKATFVRYPQDAPLKQNTLLIKKIVNINAEESELRAIAENIYKKYVKKAMTGNIQLPFANNFIDIFDLVTIISEGPNSDISFLKDLYFVVHSISEKYDVSGYTQTLEIDTDPDITKTTVSLKTVATPKSKKVKNER